MQTPIRPIETSDEVETSERVLKVQEVRGVVLPLNTPLATLNRFEYLMIKEELGTSSKGSISTAITVSVTCLASFIGVASCGIFRSPLDISWLSLTVAVLLANGFLSGAVWAAHAYVRRRSRSRTTLDLIMNRIESQLGIVVEDRVHHPTR